ncbi:methyltransferase domain-containing protein [Candidatus Woesearchaeota archaeon]|nr:methyltransferase domain-containing protein [Candidatus Woesearchaeota archaeon]
MNNPMKNSMNCDFCKHPITPVYNVPSSPRKAVVKVCSHCGLVQSTFLNNSSLPRQVAVTSEASWGNVRYGKSFRTTPHVDILDKFLSWHRLQQVIDVGSNRGSFIQAIYNKGNFPILAVEPDKHISPDFHDFPRVKLLLDRIEHISFINEKANEKFDQKFDLIYLSHTLEHLESPFLTLQQLTHHAQQHAYLFVEVPNIEFLRSKDIVEEFFIDKHTFHFSRSTLKNYLLHFGWQILYENPSDDILNITLLATLHPSGIQGKTFLSVDVPKTIAQITQYKETKEKNMRALNNVATYIEALYPKKIGIWGAGRLYHALVQHGNLNKEKIAVLIDSYLPAYVDNLNDQRILLPDEVSFKDIDVLVIMSRQYVTEITTRARQLGFHGEIIEYSGLLQQMSSSVV